ncbi:hypothetical protein L5G28_07535 [Gordonia sp. HY285]|uniref:hypothetical protein n=1 Tax=Gordonia liuliyuniae TaxID=2911517 RepID=UPI001F3AB759|nr:hypothetical protein [Gordonia liuliyuniae]MCF8610012.1 hypothetical protein [Gordonia liuliyuniae]
MSIDHDQTVDLLTVIAAYDRRTVGKGDIAAWHEAARRIGWTYPEALDAIHAHYAESTKWLMPGHITDRIKLARRQPAHADDVLAIEKKPASDETRAEFMKQLKQRMKNRQPD